jgi:hypothetical protein
MNARVAFDTHAFVKRLEAAGMSATQAEALAGAMGEIVLPSIATKPDLNELGVALRADIKELGTNLRAEMKELDLRLTMRMGVMIASSTALTVAILSAVITLS